MSMSTDDRIARIERMMDSFDTKISRLVEETSTANGRNTALLENLERSTGEIFDRMNSIQMNGCAKAGLHEKLVCDVQEEIKVIRQQAFGISSIITIVGSAIAWLLAHISNGGPK